MSDAHVAKTMPPSKEEDSSFLFLHDLHSNASNRSTQALKMNQKKLLEAPVAVLHWRNESWAAERCSGGTLSAASSATPNRDKNKHAKAKKKDACFTGVMFDSPPF